MAVLLIWSIRQYRLLKLKDRVERQLIRKEKRNFSILEELGFTKLLSLVEKKFKIAGVHYEKENTVLILMIICSLLTGGGLLINLGLISFLLPIVFVFIIYFLLGKMGESRLIKIEHELRYAMYDMASSLRVNDSLINAIAEASSKAGEPLKTELAMIVTDVSRGAKEEQALIAFSERTGSQIVASWVDTIIFAKETGKELATTCERAATKIRNKNKMKDQVRAQASGSKGTMFGILAILGLFIFSMLSTGNFGRVFMTGTGRVIITYALISYILSTLIVYKTIDREVNS